MAGTLARAPLSAEQVATYEREGIIDVGRLFSDDELEGITAGADRRLHPDNRPEGTGPADLLNLHSPPFYDSWVLELAAHPRVTAIAAQLLGTTAGVRVFATRFLCKEPAAEEGGEAGPGGALVPWHMDAHYWNLAPLKVVSVWLALDDIDVSAIPSAADQTTSRLPSVSLTDPCCMQEENGAMSVLPLDALPSPIPASTADPYPAGPHLDPANPAGGLAVETIAEVSADTGLRERPFAVQIEPSQIAAEHVRTLRLARGSASFHDVMLPHYSPPNRSTTRRRAAWICRCECSNGRLGMLPRL